MRMKMEGIQLPKTAKVARISADDYFFSRVKMDILGQMNHS